MRIVLFLGGKHEYQLRLTQPNAKEASSSCTISLISDVTLPTRLGLQPIALHNYLCLSNITSFVRQFIPLSANTDTGHLVLFEDCGSILLSRQPEE